MRRAALLALMISLALLSGCANAQLSEDKFGQWRQDFVSAPRRLIEAEVTAISEESETVFILRCESTALEDRVEVIAPEMLSKVSASVGGEENTLSYDGAVLALGGDAGERISPMMALPMLMDFLRESHFEGSWTETMDGAEVTVTELEDAQGRRLRLWQETDSMQPRFASIRSGDETELKIQIQKIE